MIIAYHRVSTTEQHLDRGITSITKYCEENNIELSGIYTDQQTGKNFNRPEYQFIKKRLLKDDTLIISELDRLGRNKTDTLKELQYFKSLGVRVMILEIPTTLVNYSNMESCMATMILETVNNMLIEMYAIFSELEISKKERRQAEGIEEMKRRGEWDKYGRPAVIDFGLFCHQYQKVIDGDMKPFVCIKELGISKSTYYKYRDLYQKIIQIKIGII